jgi:hypothetical protein
MNAVYGRLLDPALYRAGRITQWKAGGFLIATLRPVSFLGYADSRRPVMMIAKKANVAQRAWTH